MGTDGDVRLACEGDGFGRYGTPVLNRVSRVCNHFGRIHGKEPMKTIVTGGAGFIGSNASSRYLQRGHRVIVIDNLARDGVRENLEWLRPQGQLEFHQVDIRDWDALNRVFQQHHDADQVLHLAAQVAVTTSVKNPREDFEINAAGTFHVLEAMRQSGMHAPLIYSSTNKVYGEMTTIGVVERDGRYDYKS